MRTAFFLTVLFFSLTVSGQTKSPKWDSFISALQILENDYQNYYVAKDYVRTESILKQMIVSADSLNLSEQEENDFQPTIKTIKANVYYNLACVNSLLNKKQAAIADFDKAIDFGYSVRYAPDPPALRQLYSTRQQIIAFICIPTRRTTKSQRS